MPVNYLQIQQQMREKGRQAPQREQTLRELRELARQTLLAKAAALDELKKLVEDASELNSGLRCAVPGGEALDAAVAASPLAGGYTLLAADGSQVNPSRHDRVEFGVINLGAIRIQPGAQAAPAETVESQLLVLDDLYEGTRRLGEEVIALRRDLRERAMLKRLAEHEPGRVLALTDGPLELYREPKEDKEFKEGMQQYLGVLRELGQLGVTMAGYVDKPQADLVVRLLELATLPKDQLGLADQKRPFFRVTDLDLFKPILGPEQRSAVFGIQSSSARQFNGPLGLHFFYLNVGCAGHAHIARVELPQWVAQDPAALALLHAALVAQCRLMADNPYPYALHRAHEIALITFEEKGRLEDMLVQEFLKNGVELDGGTAKQRNKVLKGRRRYK
jgi:hypothetical protein